MVMPHDRPGMTKGIEDGQLTCVTIHRPYELRRLPRDANEVLEFPWCLSGTAEAPQEPAVRPEHAYLVRAAIRHMDSALIVLRHPYQDTEDAGIRYSMVA